MGCNNLSMTYLFLTAMFSYSLNIPYSIIGIYTKGVEERWRAFLNTIPHVFMVTSNWIADIITHQYPNLSYSLSMKKTLVLPWSFSVTGSHGFVMRFPYYLLLVGPKHAITQIDRFMGPTWVPSGADRTQMGPMLAPWTFLSGKRSPTCHS